MKNSNNLQERIIGGCALFLALLSACWLAGLSGCGGGTSGTGDPGTIRIQGTLQNEKGEPVAAAAITVLETGDSAVSDANGDFDILTGKGGTLHLRVEKDSWGGTLDLVGIPERDSLVTLEILLNEGQGLVTLQSVTITPIGGPNTPAAETPTPAGGEEQPRSGRSLYTGSLTFRDGLPVAGALIKIMRTGAAATTNAKGRFEIDTASIAGNVKIMVRYHDIRSSVVVPNVPPGDVIVKLKLVLQIDSFNIIGITPGTGFRPVPVTAESIGIYQSS